jgi:hypothetical protein
LLNVIFQEEEMVSWMKKNPATAKILLIKPLFLSPFSTHNLSKERNPTHLAF